MSDSTAKKSNFISNSVNAVVTVLANLETLRTLRREATVLNYATTLTEEDFIGANQHLTKANLVAAFGSIDAIIALLEANSNAHYKNLYQLKG